MPTIADMPTCTDDPHALTYQLMKPTCTDRVEHNAPAILTLIANTYRKRKYLVTVQSAGDDGMVYEGLESISNRDIDNEGHEFSQALVEHFGKS